MAKKKSDKPITKTEFLREALARLPGLDLAAINQRWAKAGHSGEISGALYHKVRRDLGMASARGAGPAADVSPDEEPRSPNRVYQLKITLRDVRPPIWRRIQVPDRPLDELHEIIQITMGWGDCHLYSFDIGPEGYTDPESALELDMNRADRVRLGDVVFGEKAKFRYTYDFGDDWRHDVLVEKILPPGEGAPSPRCLTGKRACPPDDVGGPWGYAEFLEAIRDPKHDRHEELLEWAGGEFDPEGFDLEAVNEELGGSED